MDDILFGNNNQATINRLAKRSYRANKQRNVFVTIALFLTAFMITSVFSLGCSYFETYQMQQIRAMGTTADVAITSLSEEQYEELSRSSLVSVVGVSQRLGSIDTSGMDDALLSITWIDETEWQEHRVPTISDIHGDYPQAKNEIMLSTWALRAMGIDDPQIGMNISLSYQLGTDYQYSSDEFVLSGYRANVPEHLWELILRDGITTNDNYDRDSIGEFDYTQGSGWMYSINGILYEGTGMSGYKVRNGITIYVRFTLS